MSVQLQGSTALVTGATGGIGQAIVRALHARGATVIASGRNREVLEELAREVDGVEPLVADLADAAQVAGLVFGRRIDVLVANAALPASGRLDSFSSEEIDRALDVNLRAPVQMARALVPRHARARLRTPRVHLLAVGKVRERGGLGLQRDQVRPARVRLRAERGAARNGGRCDDGLPRLHPRGGHVRRQRGEAPTRRRNAHARRRGESGHPRGSRRTGPRSTWPRSRCPPERGCSEPRPG